VFVATASAGRPRGVCPAGLLRIGHLASAQRALEQIVCRRRARRHARTRTSRASAPSARSSTRCAPPAGLRAGGAGDPQSALARRTTSTARGSPSRWRRGRTSPTRSTRLMIAPVAGLGPARAAADAPGLPHDSADVVMGRVATPAPGCRPSSRPGLNAAPKFELPPRRASWCRQWRARILGERTAELAPRPAPGARGAAGRRRRRTRRLARRYEELHLRLRAPLGAAVDRSRASLAAPRRRGPRRGGRAPRRPTSRKSSPPRRYHPLRRTPCIHARTAC